MTIPDLSIDYDHTGTLHLKHDIKISLMLCSFRPDRFEDCVKQLTETCTRPEIVEILVKTDSEIQDMHRFQEILLASPFDHRILCSPKLNEYWSLYAFLNQLAKLARGEVFWFIADEIDLRSNDWVETLLSTRDVFEDNIYLFNPRGAKTPPKFTGLPAISKEWFDVLGFLSPFPEVDVFLVKAAMRINRFYTADVIDFRMDKESWMLHDRSALRKRSWADAKKSMNRYVDKMAPIFLEKMTDPKRTPIFIDRKNRICNWTW